MIAKLDWMITKLDWMITKLDWMMTKLDWYAAQRGLERNRAVPNPRPDQPPMDTTEMLPLNEIPPAPLPNPPTNELPPVLPN